MRCEQIKNKGLSLKKGRCPSWVPKLISMSLWMSTGWRRNITPDALRIQSAFLWPTFPVNGLTDSHTPRFVVPICLSNRICEPESVIYFFYSPCFRNATITNGQLLGWLPLFLNNASKPAGTQLSMANMDDQGGRTGVNSSRLSVISWHLNYFSLSVPTCFLLYVLNILTNWSSFLL